MNRYIKNFFLYYIMPLAVMLAIAGIGRQAVWFAPEAYAATITVLVVFIAALYIYYTAAARKARNVKRSENVLQRDERTFETAQKVRENAHFYINKLRKYYYADYLERGLILLATALYVFAFASLTKIFFAAAPGFFINVPIALISLFLVKPVTASFFSKEKFSKNVLPKAKFPYITGLAYDAAQKAGFADAHILLSSENGLSAQAYDGKVYFTIGLTTLSALTREELYDSFKMFAFLCADRDMEILYKCDDMPFKDGLPVIDFKKNLVITAARVKIKRLLPAVYAAVMPVAMMSAAIKAHVRDNIPRAQLKIQMYDLMQFSSSYLFPEPYYRPAEPRDNPCSYVCDAFISCLSEKGAEWTEKLLGADKPRNSFYPSPKQFMENCGIESLNFVMPEQDGTFFEEKRAIINHMNFIVMKISSLALDYASARQVHFIMPSQTTENFELGGGVQTLDCNDFMTVRHIINAYYELRKPRQTEEICDFVLKNGVSPPAFVFYFKGKLLLERFDEQGVDFLKTAVDKNNSYVFEALSLITEFYRYTGQRQKALSFMREIYDVVEKATRENDGMGAPTRSDVLRQADIDSDMLTKIQAVAAKQNAALINIFAFKKLPEQQYPCTFIVLEYDKTADVVEKFEIYQNMFFYLDEAKNSFSLLEKEDMDPFVFVNLHKMKGTLIYSREH